MKMNKKYEVRITQQAEYALQELAFYIAYVLMAPQTAISYVNELRGAISSLQFMPERHSLTKETPWHDEGIRQMIVKNHIVYYWVDEEHDIVQITDIIYTRSDQNHALERKLL